MDQTLWMLIVGAALGGLVAWLLLRGRKNDDGLVGLVREMDAQNRELAGRISQMAEDGRKSQGELGKLLQDRLDKVTERMGKSLDDSSTKTAKSMGEIHTRLQVIDEAQKNISALSNDIVGLQDILSNKQARGAFGEVQLENLVSAILPPNAYSFQTTLDSGVRVDCLLNLPNPPGPIAVDSKFPLESYHHLVDAKDEQALKLAMAEFRTAMKKHIKDISEKYIIPGVTAESALMFLPSEAVYAELHARFPDVMELSYKARVWIVSPTTLMATLNTVRAVLKDVRMREQAGVIQKEVGMLFEDVVRLDKRVDNLARHFGQAEKDVTDIQTSTGKIAKRVAKIEEVQLEEPLDTADEIEKGLEKLPGQ